MQEENDKNSMYSEKALREGECSEGGEPDDEPQAKEEGDSGIDANSQVTIFTAFELAFNKLSIIHLPLYLLQVNSKVLFFSFNFILNISVFVCCLYCYRENNPRVT